MKTKLRVIFKIKGSKKKAEHTLLGLLRDMEHQACNFEPQRYKKLVEWRLK